MSAAASGLRSITAAGLVAIFGVELISLLSLVSAPAMAALGLVAVGTAVVLFHGERTQVRLRLDGVTVLVAAIGLLTLGTALIAAPNTWDSMTYHLPRVEHWLAQRSVAHYATTIDRQIWQPPFGEYLLLLARSVGLGSDRLLNTVQWLAAAGCGVAVARIVALLGGASRARRTAVVLLATVPPVLLQATSTQNDLVAACWCLVGAAFVVECWVEGGATRGATWALAAFGLAIGTKGTGLLFALPWLAALALYVVREKAADRWHQLAVGSLVVLALNGPWMARNVATYGNPLGDPVVQRLLRPASMAPASIGANLLANASVHWAVPSEGLRRATDAAVLRGFRMLGAEPAQLFPYFGGFRVVPWSTDEDQSGAPFLFALGAAAVLLSLLRWRRLQSAERLMLVAVLSGCLLFGLLVRWQPFNARLQLPGLLLFVPMVALLLDRVGRAASLVVGAAAVGGAIPPLVANASRPLVAGWMALGEVQVPSILSASREAQYFARAPVLAASYAEVAARLKAGECREVAVKAGYDSWEYPLWALLRGGSPVFRLRPNWVENATRVHQPPAPMPCAVVALDQPAGWTPAPLTGWSAMGSGRIVLWLPGPTNSRTP